MPVRTAAKVLSLGLLLAGSAVSAQQPSFSLPAAPGGTGLIFKKEANATPAFQPNVVAPTPRPTLVFRKEPALLTGIPPASAATSTPALPATPSADVGPKFDVPAVPVAFQGQRMDLSAPGDDVLDYNIRLDPPGPNEVFKLESEASLHERIRQESRQRSALERIQFPEEPILSKERYKGRHWAPHVKLVEPAYVCHRPLLFEERNSERFAWDFGVVSPVVSSGYFFFDVATLPYHVASRVGNWFECSAGKCLPGDPVPYMLNPPELNLPATVVEAGTILALCAIFP